MASGSRSPLRERARNILVNACADGSLEHSLDKPDTFSNFEVDLNARAQSPAGASDGSGGGQRRGAMFWKDPAAGSDAGGSGGSAEFHRKKPPSHGLQAALQLAAKQNDTCKECHVAPPSHAPSKHSVAAALHVSALHQAASVDEFRPSSPASAEGSERSAAGRARVELERTMNLEKEERNLAKKFAEADRQSAAKELALKLYRERSIYIEGKLRPLLDKLVAQVSAPSQRPDNPVPLMIELLAEFAGKPTTYFKTGPEDRLMKEILVLEREIDELAKALEIESVSGSEED